MKKTLLIITVMLFAYACKQAAPKVEGSWVAPIEGMEPFQWGFTLNPDGSALSINSATLQYKTWEIKDDKLVLQGESIGNGQTIVVSDTFSVKQEKNKIQAVISAAGVVYTFAEKTDADNIVKEYGTEYCFKSNSDQAQVQFRYKQAGDVIRGSMVYEIPGKDKSFGSVSGTLVGDTLIGNFDFFAEGGQSYREIVLLKSGNSWKEGTGEIVSEGNVAMFKSRGTLDFSKGIVLDPSPCK